MKKILLSLVVITMVVFSASAHEHDKNYAPSEGDISLEVNFTPLGPSPIQVDFIQARYFLNSNMAVRLGLLFNYASFEDQVQTAGAGTGGSLLTENFSSTGSEFGLFAGFEYHFGGTGRLSPYAGLELGIVSESYEHDYSNSDGDRASVSGSDAPPPTLGNIAQSMFGFSLFAGFDYYIYDGLFLGAEMGLGLSSISFDDVVFSETPAGGSTTTITTENDQSITNFGVVFNPAIRLGWRF